MNPALDQTRRSVNLALAACALAVLPACCGCHERSLPRVAVEGQVTLDGASLDKGTIVFSPLPGTSGPRAGGQIVGGRYKLDERLGPMVGSLRVEIRGEPQNAPEHPDDDPQYFHEHIGREPLLDPVPAMYNDQSTLVVETTAEGPNTFDFDLQSAPAQP